MGDAPKVIDWNGTDFHEALAGVPPGRYQLEAVQGPADEPGDEPGAEPDDFELTPEIEAKIEAGVGGQAASVVGGIELAAESGEVENSSGRATGTRDGCGTVAGHSEVHPCTLTS